MRASATLAASSIVAICSITSCEAGWVSRRSVPARHPAAKAAWANELLADFADKEVLEHKGKRIKVRNKGPKPDSFKDKSEVVAEGRIVEENGEPVLVATNLMAKCPSKYEGAPKDQLFEN